MNRLNLPIRPWSTNAADWLVPALLALASPVAGATDWYVDSQNPNCSSGTGGVNDPFCKIQDAVNAASDGDTIHIAPATYFENLIVDKDLVLVGTSGAVSTIVDGGSAGSVVIVPQSMNVEIHGLTITHGKAKDGGGILVERFASLVLDNVVVSANSADGGGGIYSCGEVTCHWTRISDNSAGFGGGVVNEGTFVAYDSVIESNAAKGGGGSFTQSPAESVFHRCLVRSNKATEGGGGLCSVDDTDVRMYDCEIALNVAPYGGAGEIGGTLRMVDCLVHDNVASSDGGAFASYGKLSMNRTLVERNYAGGNGGAILAWAGDDLRCTCVFLGDCIVRNNEAAADGGGIYLLSDGAEGFLDLNRTVVGSNKAGLYGGGIVGRNNAGPQTGLWMVDSTVQDNVATLNGGGLQLFGNVQLGLDRSTIAGNTAQSGGGIINKKQSTVESHLSVIAGNTAATGPDFAGPLTSKGYNLIGNTGDCTILGDPTGNLLDVDPLFADPASGDYSLQPHSPCVDSEGTSTPLPAGKDLRGSPRLLDGDLDRTMIVDMGAFEFDHVQLAVSGNATPGGTLTLTSSGTPGMFAFLFIGTTAGEVSLAPFGALFLDVASPWNFFPLAILPDIRTLTIPTNYPTPQLVVLQELALKSSPVAGNFSNVVQVVVQ